MYSKIQSLLFFVMLTALCLAINSPASLAFVSAQEEQAAKTNKDTEDLNKAKKSSESKAVTDNPDSTKSDNAAHQHQAIIKAPIDAFTQQQQDIEHYLATEEISSLLVGSEKYLIATNKHTTAINKGVMVLIPDWQQSILCLPLSNKQKAILELSLSLPKVVMPLYCSMFINKIYLPLLVQ